MLPYVTCEVCVVMIYVHICETIICTQESVSKLYTDNMLGYCCHSTKLLNILIKSVVMFTGK